MWLAKGPEKRGEGAAGEKKRKLTFPDPDTRVIRLLVWLVRAFRIANLSLNVKDRCQ